MLFVMINRSILLADSAFGSMDRISQLPESITHHILSFLDPPILNLVRMSVLSKKWLALTASFPNLDFNLSAFDAAMKASGKNTFNDDYIRDKFFNYVDSTISKFYHHNVNMHTFKLITSYRETKEDNIINRWVELVLKKRVQVMVIDIRRHPYAKSDQRMYRLPNVLLSASFLECLTIGKCDLPMSLMVDDIKFKSLKRLEIVGVVMDDEMIKRLTTSCHLLEEISIIRCYGYKRLCICGIQNLKKIVIHLLPRVLYRSLWGGLERIDIDAPNLRHLILIDVNWNETALPFMNLFSCKRLRTITYDAQFSVNTKWLADFLSNPFVEELFLTTPSQWNNLKLSSNSLRILVLNGHCDLDELEINAPNLLLFKYIGELRLSGPSVTDLRESKTRMECYSPPNVDSLWFQKLRRFLGKHNGFKYLRLCDSPLLIQSSIDVAKLKVIHLPPYELEHIELTLEYIREVSGYVAIVDAVLWCCHPQSLSLSSHLLCIDIKEWFRVVKFTYEKLLQQDDQGLIDIKFVLSSSSESRKHFSNLNALFMALVNDKQRQRITFVKQ